ncbi:MAG: glycerophosphodiester phosphodiesterase family protein [Acidobacteriota bacterium]
MVLVIDASRHEGLAQYKKKTLVAHRGASAYAPEHTLAAYRLALDQRADFVEQDLQITRDGVLVCLHDLTLERTTNIEEIFPERYRKEGSLPNGRHWFVSDFTVDEIKRLDAGSWFGEQFRNARVPTWQEAIDLIRGRAGLFPETKGPEVYADRGFSMETLVLEQLKKSKLDKPGADVSTPVIIQSFSVDSLRRLGSLGCRLPMVLLIGTLAGENEQMLSREGLQEIRRFAGGIGPAKRFVLERPEIVRWAHDLGLSVTPYTFRSRDAGKFKNVSEEMSHFLFTLGVDAVFTDNPDQFPF